MKQIVLLILFTSLVSCSSEQTVVIEQSGIEGVIFTESFQTIYTDGEVVNAGYFVPEKVKDVWTVNEKDVINVENEIKAKFTTPFQKSELRKYFRQYIGYVDTLGKQNIWITFTNLPSLKNDLLEMPLVVQDADSFYFNVHYSIEDSTFFDLRFY